ncbi:MAG: hypothetical protein EU547_02825 [Promethearchaeota archaeon]|nr:MAG: hypothetical protein EU547_02825 [Candidatus Lokiarchaeota archaeon]
MNANTDSSNLRSAKVKAVIIATNNGIPLVSVKTSSKIDEKLISPFFSAIKQFSESTLDFSKEGLDFLHIKGGDVESLVARNHGLILIALMDKEMKKIGVQKEAEEALDLFYEMYRKELDEMENNCVDLNVFKEFEAVLKNQIQDYYEKIEQDEGGFFNKFIKFFKKELS